MPQLCAHNAAGTSKVRPPYSCAYWRPDTMRLLHRFVIPGDPARHPHPPFPPTRLCHPVPERGRHEEHTHANARHQSRPFQRPGPTAPASTAAMWHLPSCPQWAPHPAPIRKTLQCHLGPASTFSGDSKGAQHTLRTRLRCALAISVPFRRQHGASKLHDDQHASFAASSAPGPSQKPNSCHWNPYLYSTHEGRHTRPQSVGASGAACFWLPSGRQGVFLRQRITGICNVSLSKIKDN